jgi:hypothetical protein
MAIPSTARHNSSKISPPEFLFKTSTGWKNQLYSEEIGVHVSRALRTNFEQFKVIASVFPIRIPIKLHLKKDKAKSLESLSERFHWSFEWHACMRRLRKKDVSQQTDVKRV